MFAEAFLKNKIVILLAIALPLVLVALNQIWYLLVPLAGIAVWLIYYLAWDRFLLYGLAGTLIFSFEAAILGNTKLFFPVEILATLLAGTTLIALLKEAPLRQSLRTSYLFKSMLALLASYFVSAFFSTMPLVSFKYGLVMLVYFLSGIGLYKALRAGTVNLKLWLLLLILPVLLLSILSLTRLSVYGFNPGAASLMAQPFFKDHTVFSATIVLLLPLIFYFQKFKSSTFWQWFFAAILLCTVWASSSRAAWISLAAILMLYGAIKVQLSVKFWGVLSAILLALLVFGKSHIVSSVSQNINNSTSQVSGVQEQVLSVANVSTDVSNLERINRWFCAWEMFKDKPIIGFGPGTYQFEYFPYQRDKFETILSVYSPYGIEAGKGGSAHSEYFLFLSETGLVGSLAWLNLLFAFFYSALKRLKKETVNGRLALLILLGISSYLVHGFFNNFLNIAQPGIIFWALMSILIFLKNETNGD